ncbi:hypothetical protein D3C75_738020 [compost metagenome]
MHGFGSIGGTAAAGGLFRRKEQLPGASGYFIRPAGGGGAWDCRRVRLRQEPDLLVCDGAFAQGGGGCRWRYPPGREKPCPANPGGVVPGQRQTGCDDFPGPDDGAQSSSFGGAPDCRNSPNPFICFQKRSKAARHGDDGPGRPSPGGTAL